MNHGNIYLTAKFNSYNPTQTSATFYRMGTLDYKGSIKMYLKELVQLIPFSSYFFNCHSKQQITIKVADNFNNAEYATSNIELSLANTDLQFTKAVLKVRASLHGIRYLMRSWFYTIAFISILSMTISLFIFSISMFFVIKVNLKQILHKYYHHKKQPFVIKVPQRRIRTSDIDSQ